jgi:hypothetical protein
MASASSISFATDRRRNASLALVCFALAALLSQRAWSEDEPMPFKLSLGDYHVSGGGMPSGPGLDVKLRYSYGNEDSGGHVWLGYFRSTALDIAQPRAGWDARLPLGPVRVLPSLQAASGGFLGGSLAVETGDTWVVGGGLGRTNLRPYANLNFDPNDSLTV